mgnify:CR=1 FL=1
MLKNRNVIQGSRKEILQPKIIIQNIPFPNKYAKITNTNNLLDICKVFVKSRISLPIKFDPKSNAPFFVTD